jgi:hypothetical protein
MIFYENQEVEPARVGGDGFDLISEVGGPLREVEFWTCHFCGKVRSVQQWKRARVLADRGVPPNQASGVYTDSQLRGVAGVDLLPDGWALVPNKYTTGQGSMRLRLLACDVCAEKDHDPMP